MSTVARRPAAADTAPRPGRAGETAEAAVCALGGLQAVPTRTRLGTPRRSAARTVPGCARAECRAARAPAPACGETTRPVLGLVRARTTRVAAAAPAAYAYAYVHRGATGQDAFAGATPTARGARR